MKRWSVYCAYIGAVCIGFLHAGTVRLFNDSPFRLRGVVRGSDGTLLGEYIINSQTSSTWSDTWDGYSPPANPSRSQTPYTVLWYCLDGAPFSTANYINTGGTATAMGGDGAKQCRGKNLQQEAPNSQQAPPLPPVSPPPYPMPPAGT